MLKHARALPGRSPLNSPDTILAIIFTAAYASDVLLNFFVAYYDYAGTLVVSLRDIAGERRCRAQGWLRGVALLCLLHA